MIKDVTLYVDSQDRLIAASGIEKRQPSVSTFEDFISGVFVVIALAIISYSLHRMANL